MSSAQCAFVFLACLLVASCPAGAQQSGAADGSMLGGFDISVLMTSDVQDVMATLDRIKMLINTSMPALNKDIDDLQTAFNRCMEATTANGMAWTQNMTTLFLQYIAEMNATAQAIQPAMDVQIEILKNNSMEFAAKAQLILGTYMALDGTIGEMLFELLPPLLTLLDSNNAAVMQLANLSATLHSKGARSPKIGEALQLIANYNQLQGDVLRDYLHQVVSILRNLSRDLRPATGELDSLLVKLTRTQIRVVLDSPLREAGRFVTAMLKSTLQPVFDTLNQTGSMRDAPDPQSAGFVVKLYDLLLNATPSMLGSLERMLTEPMGPVVNMTFGDLSNATMPPSGRNGSHNLRSLLQQFAPPQLIQLLDALLMPNSSSNQPPPELAQVLSTAQMVYFGTDGGISLRKFLSSNFLRNLDVQPELMPRGIVDMLKNASQSMSALVPMLDMLFNVTHDLNSIRMLLKNVVGIDIIQQIYSGDGNPLAMLPGWLNLLHLLMPNGNRTLPGLNMTLTPSTSIGQVMDQLFKMAPSLLAMIPHGFVETISSGYDALLINGQATLTLLFNSTTLLPAMMAINTTQEIPHLLDQVEPYLVMMHDKQLESNRMFVNYTKIYIEMVDSTVDSTSKDGVTVIFNTIRDVVNGTLYTVRPFDLKLSVFLDVVKGNGTVAEKREMRAAFVKWGSNTIKSQTPERQQIICGVVDSGARLTDVAMAVQNEFCVQATGARKKRAAASTASGSLSSFQTEMTSLLQNLRTLLVTKNVDPPTLGYIDMFKDAISNWNKLDPYMAQAMTDTMSSVLTSTSTKLIELGLSGATGAELMSKVKLILNNAEDAMMAQMQDALFKLSNNAIGRMNATVNATGNLTRQLDQFVRVAAALQGQSITLQQAQNATGATLNTVTGVVRNMTSFADWPSMWQSLNATAMTALRSLKDLTDTNAGMFPSSLFSKMTQFQGKLASLSLTATDFSQLLNDSATLTSLLDLATQALQLPPEVLVLFSAAGGVDSSLVPRVEQIMNQYINSLLTASNMMLTRYLNVTALSQLTSTWNDIDRTIIDIYSSLPQKSRDLLSMGRSYRDSLLSMLSSHHIEFSRLAPLLNLLKGKAVGDVQQVFGDLGAFVGSFVRELLLNGSYVTCGNSVEVISTENYVLAGIFTAANCAPTPFFNPPPPTSSTTTTTKSPATGTNPATSSNAPATATPQSASSVNVKLKISAPWNDDLKNASSAAYAAMNTQCKDYFKKVCLATTFKDNFKEVKDCTFSQGSVVMAASMDMNTGVAVDSFTQQAQTAVSSNADLQTFNSYTVSDFSLTPVLSDTSESPLNATSRHISFHPTSYNSRSGWSERQSAVVAWSGGMPFRCHVDVLVITTWQGEQEDELEESPAKQQQ